MNYYWDGQQVLQGNNPYDLWADGTSGSMRADIPPLELLILSLVVYFVPHVYGIRLFFVFFDALILICLAYLYRHNRQAMWSWLLLYGFGPAPLYMFTLTPVDRPLLFSLLLLTLIVVESAHTKRRWLSAILIGLLGAIKWLGIFIGFTILMQAANRKWRDLFILGAIAGGIFLGSHLLWFPSWQIVYEFRSARMQSTPFHTGIAVVLQSLGIYMPSLYQPLMILSWVAVQVAWWFEYLSLRQSITLSFMASVYWAVDVTPQMLWFITMFLLLAIDWFSLYRLIWVWILMIFETLLFATSVYPSIGAPFSLDIFVPITPLYGTVLMSFMSQWMVWVCLFWLIYDNMKGPQYKRKSRSIDLISMGRTD